MQGWVNFGSWIGRQQRRPVSAWRRPVPLRCYQVNDMHARTFDTSTRAASCLVDIIELKWLLAGHGLRIHVEQLQQDPEYARRTLDCAASAASPVLREVAARLRKHLGLSAP
jgi:hypothetical protein